MDIFLHSNEQLMCSQHVLESYVVAFLGDGGRVRGGRSGSVGWYLDVEVLGDKSEAKLQEFAAFLKRFRVPPDTTLRYILSDGSEHTIIVHECLA